MAAGIDDDRVRGNGAVGVTGSFCRTVALRLLEPGLSHAGREHVAALLAYAGGAPELGEPSVSGSTSLKVWGVADLVHDLEVAAQVAPKRGAPSVHIGAVYPLPWGFREEGSALKGAIEMLLRDALRGTRRGFVTVAIGFDIAAKSLWVSIVDSRPQRDARRRVAVGEGFRSEVRRGRSRAPATAWMRRIHRQIGELGGRIGFAVSSLGHCMVELECPVVPVGPLLQSDNDIGREPRMRTSPPVRRYRGRGLIVDRSVSTMRSLSVILRAHGVATVSSPHGRLAVEVLRAVPCDVVWIDVEDPLVRAGELRERLGGVGFSGRVVGLSAHRGYSVIAAERPSPFDVVIPKPVARSAVSRCLERFAETDQVAPQGGGGGPRISVAPHQRGDAEVAGVIAEYLHKLPELLAELDRALAQNDYRSAARVAHTLKAGAVFGFKEVSASARGVEGALRACDVAKIRRSRDELASVILRLQLAPPPSSRAEGF